MALGINANVGTINAYSNSVKNDGKNGAPKADKIAQDAAYNVDVSKNGNGNHANNVQYANGNTSIEDIKNEVSNREDQLNVNFSDESKNFDKANLSQQSGSYTAALANVSKEVTVGLLQ